MEIEIRWQKPILIARQSKLYVTKSSIPKQLKRKPGVYFFSRQSGKGKKTYHHFYIGESQNIRSRLRSHLRNADLRDALRGVDLPDFKTLKQGRRFFHVGYYVPKVGQSAKKCIGIVKRYMIREAVAQGQTLLNSQLTVIKTHKLSFRGRRSARGVYPKRASVERA